MSNRKPKPRQFKQPTLNAIYKQQLLLRAAVAALVDQIEEMRVRQVEQLTLAIQHNHDTGARMEKLQFDRGVLMEKVRKYREMVTGKQQPSETSADVIGCICGWRGKRSVLFQGHFCPQCGGEPIPFTATEVLKLQTIQRKSP